MEEDTVTSSVTAPTSSSQQSFRSAKSNPSSTYRPTREVPMPFHRQVMSLPYELREHCMIYFEEGLYCQALDLLISLLISGTASRAQVPAILPPPRYIALIATLAVHPTLTTRAKSPDRLQASNLALQYLQLVLTHTGPLHANLKDAFAFRGQGIMVRPGHKAKRKSMKGEVSLVDNNFETIESELANTSSLWSRADDFWHVVGWCFNCSVLHKRRWERWTAWLTYMVDVLEADWEARDRMNEGGANELSLIMQYLGSGGAIPGREKKVVRAIFADGRVKSVAEFGEIWKNETKELRKEVDIKKVERKIDIEADSYGDYLENEDESELEDSALESSPTPEVHYHVNSIPDTADTLGGMDSINLRIRLLSLISKISASLPQAFTTLNTLYDIFLDHIRPLPVPAFFLVMSPPTLRHFVPAATSTLTQYILREIIAASAPAPASDDLSQNILETNYLPFPANTTSIADNTKVSLCIETLLRLLDTHPSLGLSWTPELHKAAEAGINARAIKAKKKQTKRGSNGVGACDLMWLAASAERIRSLIAMTRSAITLKVPSAASSSINSTSI